jgi:HPt (histidine-containing phosphotransfer) domain-containing protein
MTSLENAMTSPKPADRRPLLSDFSSDPEMCELVDLFVNDMPQRVTALQASWDAGNARDVQRMAHQIRGAAGGYGFPSVSRHAAQLEDAIKAMDASTSASLAGLQRQFDDLISLLQRVSVK